MRKARVNKQGDADQEHWHYALTSLKINELYI